MREPIAGASPTRRIRLPIVGVGASAESLKAFQAFLHNVPPDTEMAFVLVQHLDPHHRSEPPSLLRTHTRLPVAQVDVVLDAAAIPAALVEELLTGVMHVSRDAAAVARLESEGVPQPFDADKVVLTVVDVTDLEASRAEVTRRARQQGAVAELGQLALTGAAPERVMQAAVESVAEHLGVDLTKVLELLPSQDALVLRAGVGWTEGFVGETVVGTDLDSQAGYTLRSDSAVIVQDLAREARFSGPPLLTDHGVVSGVSVIVRGTDGPWGVLGAHSRTRMEFSQDDVNFVQAVANIIADALRNHRAEEALRRANAELECRVDERTEDLRRANARLREQEAFLRTIYDEVGLAVYVIDVEEDDFRYVDLNPEFLRMTGLTRDAVVGKRLDEMHHLPAAILATMRTNYREVVTTGDLVEYETRVPTRGDDSWWIVTLNPVKDADDAVYRIIGTALPITQRKQAELAVQREKEVNERLIQSSFDGILAFDRELRYTVWNRAMERISGVSARDTLGQVSYQVFPFLEATGEIELFRRTLEGDSVVSMDQWFEVEATGRSGYFEATYTPLRDRDDTIVGGLGIVRETTERKHAEDSLRASEERFRAIFEQSPPGTCLLILDGWTVIDVNDNCEDVLGSTRDGLRGTSLLELALWEASGNRDALQAFVETGDSSRELELRVVRDEIGTRVLRGSLERITFAEKEHTLVTLEDVTEQATAAEEIRELRLRLIDIQDKERLALARELHDHVIQQLLAINQALAQMEKDFDGAAGATPIHVEAYRRDVLALVEQLRRTIRDLRPAGLEEFGLTATLASFVAQLRSEIGPDGPELHSDLEEIEGASFQVAHTLYRVAQEALRNAVKHADARRVRVELRHREGAIQLRVEDDGRGFDPPDRLSAFVQDDHFGLVGMEERLSLHGGRLTVRTAPGRGTTLLATLPSERTDG